MADNQGIIMPIPINIKDLVSGRIVEWERVEFKVAWNREAVLHTICAFANDFNNWGGGYIVLGIAEQNGILTIPPVGINPDKVDQIQKELLNLCNRIRLPYFPKLQPVEFMGNIAKLKVQGLLERIGGRKKGQWKVIESADSGKNK